MSDFGFSSPRGSSKSGQGVPVRPNGMNMGPPLTASSQRGRGRGGGRGGGRGSGGGSSAFRGSQMTGPGGPPSGMYSGGDAPFPRMGPPMQAGGRPAEYMPTPEYPAAAGGYYEYPKAYQPGPPRAHPQQGTGQRYPGSEYAPAPTTQAPPRTYEGTLTTAASPLIFVFSNFVKVLSACPRRGRSCKYAC